MPDTEPGRSGDLDSVEKLVSRCDTGPIPRIDETVLPAPDPSTAAWPVPTGADEAAALVARSRPADEAQSPESPPPAADHEPESVAAWTAPKNADAEVPADTDPETTGRPAPKGLRARHAVAAGVTAVVCAGFAAWAWLPSAASVDAGPAPAPPGPVPSSSAPPPTTPSTTPPPVATGEVRGTGAGGGGSPADAEKPAKRSPAHRAPAERKPADRKPAAPPPANTQSDERSDSGSLEDQINAYIRQRLAEHGFSGGMP
ncbi:hypothetical protein [Amycolatopsis jejuensis]|uniref:hypothetical protein n=1 Tax=Amycolatopsis jejuensis TaxID=330084 RepID=UPI00052550F0|nr:hypothetical protein [Amycolatopsis jejuensis]